MGFSSVPLLRRRRGPANEVANYRPMWEGRTDTAGWFTAVVQVQALEGVAPAIGWVRARNVTTGAITADVAVGSGTGRAAEIVLPELACSAGDLLEVQARPGIATAQVYIEAAAGTVSTVALTTTPPAAVPAVFGALAIDPTSLALDDTFEVSAVVSAGSTDLGAVMTVELEWKTPDGSNPMGGTAMGGGWYRGLEQTISATPATITWDDAELVAAPTGTHQIRFAATNSTGVTISEPITFAVTGAAVTQRGFVLSSAGSATTHSIPSSSVTANGAAVSGTNPSVLQTGDKVLLVITAMGPGEEASVTVSHPGTLIPGGNIPGSGFYPRMRLALVDYTGPTTWTVTGTHPVRVAAVAFAGAAHLAAGSPSYGATPLDPAGITNDDNSLGLFIQSINWDNTTGITVTGAPSGHTTVLNSGIGVRQIYVARQATATAGTYNPGAATTASTTPPGAGSEGATAVAVTVSPTAPGTGGGGGGSTSTPTVPTFNSATAVTITPSDNAAAIVAARPEGTHFDVTAGTHYFNDVRPKTGMHFRGAGEGVTILEGIGKGWAFRSGTLGTSDNVTIGQMTIQRYGQGTTHQMYGAIQALPTNTIGGQWDVGRSNNWFIYSCTLWGNASSAIAMSDNCTIYDCTIWGHTVTGINCDMGVGGLIHSCLLEANALEPATGAYSNGAQIKVTWHNAGPARVANVATAWRRPSAPLVVTGCTMNATRSGVTGVCRIGFWADLDCRDTLIDGNTFNDHTYTSIFFEGCNGAMVTGNTVNNSDGYGPAYGSDFRNAAIACGESNNITFDGNTVNNSDWAMMNRLSRRTADWYNANNASYVNYSWPASSGGVRPWINHLNSVPAVGDWSNMWTGNNTFSNNILNGCLYVAINEGTNGAGQTVQGATDLTNIHFTGNDYSGSPSIRFYEPGAPNVQRTLAQWQALPNDRDQ